MAKDRAVSLKKALVPVGKPDALPEAARSERTYFQTMELSSDQQKRLKMFSAETERPHKEILVTALMKYLDDNGAK